MVRHTLKIGQTHFINLAAFAHASSATYLITRLQKTFSSFEAKKDWPHAGL